MTTLIANHITSDANTQSGTISHWFEVGGEEFAISECDGEMRLLDCDGFPVEECNDHGNIKQLLIDADPCSFTIN